MCLFYTTFLIRGWLSYGLIRPLKSKKWCKLWKSTPSQLISSSAPVHAGICILRLVLRSREDTSGAVLSNCLRCSSATVLWERSNKYYTWAFELPQWFGHGHRLFFLRILLNYSVLSLVSELQAQGSQCQSRRYCMYCKYGLSCCLCKQIYKMSIVQADFLDK